jgi:hypothetical protein
MLLQTATLLVDPVCLSVSVCCVWLQKCQDKQKKQPSWVEKLHGRGTLRKIGKYYRGGGEAGLGPQQLRRIQFGVAVVRGQVVRFFFGYAYLRGRSTKKRETVVDLTPAPAVNALLQSILTQSGDGGAATQWFKVRGCSGVRK